MKINNELLRQVESDLGLNVPHVKGQSIQIKNCWHFSSDGNLVDAMFYDEQDFKDGMNRVFIVNTKYQIIILAFCLMDTHVHFILYGHLKDCEAFMHEYIKRTSQHLAQRYGEFKKFNNLPINYQAITDDNYLKTAICYVIKNPPVAGIRKNAYDYPWSSAALYFREGGHWTSPRWTDELSMSRLSSLGRARQKELLRSNKKTPDALLIDDIVFPGEYVAYEIVENIFKTCKSFNYFLCKSKDADIESTGGSISHLSIPNQELMQHRNLLIQDMYHVNSIRLLNTTQRLNLARALHSQLNCSPKQIIKLSGLKYNEVKDIFQLPYPTFRSP